MNTIRSLLFVIWIYGGMVVVGTVFLPTLILPGPLARYAAVVWAHQVRFGVWLILGTRTELRGQENFPDGPVLIAGKHQAMYDVLIPFILRGGRPAIILKKELLWYPIFGWYAWRMGCIPIDRNASASALKDMVARARQRFAEGRDVLIFPEGTRVAPDAAPDYKPGVAALYRALNVSCVPMATNAGLVWPAKGLLRRPGRIVYSVMEPIPAGLQRRDFAARLESGIEEETARLLGEGRNVQDRL